MLSDASEIRFPSGLWSCPETAESSYQSSLVINLSFSFIPLLSSSVLQEILKGLFDLLRGWFCMPRFFLVQICEILHMVASILQRFALVLCLIQRDLLCSAADFYNVSSLKKSRTVHTVVCVFMEVCVYMCLYLLSAVCVRLKEEVYNEQWAVRRHGSFLQDDQHWETLSDGHALIDSVSLYFLDFF